MTPDVLTVPLGDRTYDIFFGREIYPLFQEWICRFFPGGSVFVVTDRNVASIYGGDIRRWLDGIPHSVLALEPGEEHKTWEAVRGIYSFLAGGGADRESLLVAFGGGVVGDLAGFAAATYLRGIPYIGIPTTLLAQVDSSVGGKSGFNLPEGKNLAGAFYQPRAVFVDGTFLRTLDRRNLRAGMAEVVKCGLAGDAALWDLVRGRAAAWEKMEEREWQEVVRRSVAFKAAVVSRDEREGSLRRVLNLGHTVGHAVEQAAGYGRLLHGEAVAMGLAWEAAFGRRLGMTPPEVETALCEVLVAMGFSLDDPSVALTSIAAAIGADKKRVSHDLFLPIVTAPGRCVVKKIPVSLLRRELPALRAAVGGRAAGGQPAARETGASGGFGGGPAGAAQVADLERRVAADPRDVRALVELARAYAATGNPAGAWETIKGALEIAPADPEALRAAREIEPAAAAAGQKEAPHPLEEVIVIEEGTFALRPAEKERPPAAGTGAPAKDPAWEETAGEGPCAQAPLPEAARVEAAPEGGEAAGEKRKGQARAAEAAPPVRTVTMADIYWEQGEREVARRIVREILAADPGDARAAAWLARRGQTDEEGALLALLDTIRGEFGHDLSRTH